MTGSPRSRTAGHILVDRIHAHGVRTAFCVPGESFLPILDAFHDRSDLQLITCRQEGGAAFMAEAYGRLTGRPGVCLVTRGPGATNASIGVHAAMQASTPMILIVGQVPRAFLGREAFQEVDIPAMFAPLAKWSAQVPSAQRMHEYVDRAFHVAVTGRPGPVVLAAPEDVLSGLVDTETSLTTASRPTEGAADPSSLLHALASARRPLVVVGGGGWTASAAGHIAEWAERNELPVAAEFRCQDYVDNESPAYVGELGLGANPALVRRTAEADVLLVIGSRLGEITTQGYRTIEVGDGRQRLLHVGPDPDEIGSLYATEIGVTATSTAIASALAAAEAIRGPWGEWSRQARADFEQWRVPKPSRETFDLGLAVAAIDELLPDDAVITNGAGNYTAWVQRFCRFRSYGTQLAPASGAMGYGLPAAITAKLTAPDRTVIAFAGDGCLLMNGQELATAMRYNLAIVVVVINNGILGTIRMHQEARYPGRRSGTDLTNPDFVAYARSFGALAWRVTTTEEVGPALAEAVASGRPALIELQAAPAVISPTRRIVMTGAGGLIDG